MKIKQLFTIPVLLAALLASASCGCDKTAPKEEVV